MFSREKLSELNDGVLDILENVGMKVCHEELRAILKSYGAIVDDSRMNARFPLPLVDALAGAQREYAGAHDPFAAKRAAIEYAPRVNDAMPFILDARTNRKRYATMDDIYEVLKVQHQIPEIKKVHSPLIVGGIDMLVEPLYRYMSTFEITDKEHLNDGFWDPRIVPWLVEMDAIDGRTKDNPGIINVNVAISPLTIDEEMSKRMLMYARCGYTNSVSVVMPLAGGNAPITVEGTALVAAAEILGCSLIVDAVNRHCGLHDAEKIKGVSVTGVMDMRTMQASCGAPEAILQDMLVHEMFREVYSSKIGFCPDYTDAKLPGMQCVYERVMKYMACANMAGPGYVSNFSCGNLLTSTVHSNVQMLVDLELGRGLHKFYAHAERGDVGRAVDEIKSVVGSGEGSFLGADMTAEFFKDIFYSFVFDRSAWKDETSQEREGEILREAEAEYGRRLAEYRVPELDRRKLAEMKKLIATAEKALG